MGSPTYRAYRLKPNYAPRNARPEWLIGRKQMSGVGNAELSRLRAGKAVSLEVAEAAVLFAKATAKTAPETLPPDLLKSLSDATVEQGVEAMFEHAPIAAQPVREANDPIGGNFYRFTGWLLESIGGDATRRVLQEPTLPQGDPEAAAEDYLKRLYTDVGAQVAAEGDGEPMTAAEAELRGRGYLADDPEVHRRGVRKALATNPDCLRYATDDEGRRVGLSLVVPLPEATWGAVASGKITGYEELLESPFEHQSNVLFIAGFFEAYDGEVARVKQRRWLLAMSHLSQLARLRNPAGLGPMRIVTHAVVDANRKRLANAMFDQIADLTREGGPKITLHTYDPRRGPIAVQAIKRTVDIWIASLRQSLDAGGADPLAEGGVPSEPLVAEVLDQKPEGRP